MLAERVRCLSTAVASLLSVPLGSVARVRTNRAGVARAILAVAMVGVLSGGFTAGSAAASPSRDQTVEFHGGAAYDQVIIDFLPGDVPQGISLPPACWLPPTDAFMSVSGTAIVHQNMNTSGSWFTSSFSGDAAVYPIVFSPTGTVERDSQGNVLVDTSASPSAVGHLYFWEAAATNNMNAVNHATLNFEGADSSGKPVSMHGHFQFATNAAGNPTAAVGTLAC